MKRNAPLPAFVLTLFLAAAACNRSFRSATSSNTETTTHTITFAGSERTYILHVPTSYTGSESVPLVLDFHGGGGNAVNEMDRNGFKELADTANFIVAYPNGNGRREDKLLTWNGGTCCGYAVTNNMDDVGFVRAVIADIEAGYKIDAKRVFATGFSNGAIMSQRLACEASDVFAAIAPVSGTLNYLRCDPSQPVAVIEFHGTDDGHINYNGGAGPDSLVDAPFASVADSVGFWVNADQCQMPPATESYSDIQHDSYSGCMQGTSVELYTIFGGKHAWPGGNGPAWPGGDEPPNTISATQLIWEFFKAHPKQ